MFKKKVAVSSVVFMLLMLVILTPNVTISSAVTEKKPLCPIDPSKVVDMTEYFKARHSGSTGGPDQPDLGRYLGEVQKEQTTTSQEMSRSYSSSIHWGTMIPQIYYSEYTLERIWGTYAIQYLNGSLTLGTGEDRLLYAPTMRSPKPCPFEIATMYESDPDGHMEYYIAVWDFTISPPPGTWSTWMTFDEAEEDGYLQEDGDLYYYRALIYYNLAEYQWEANIYHFSSDRWHTMDNSEDMYYGHRGWDFYEAYYNGTVWVDTGLTRSKDILVYVLTLPSYWNWFYVTSYYGYEADNDENLTLTHDFEYEYYEWFVGDW